MCRKEHLVCINCLKDYLDIIIYQGFYNCNYYYNVIISTAESYITCLVMEGCEEEYTDSCLKRFFFLLLYNISLFLFFFFVVKL
jgi:hypothetical protein